MNGNIGQKLVFPSPSSSPRSASTPAQDDSHGWLSHRSVKLKEETTSPSGEKKEVSTSSKSSSISAEDPTSSVEEVGSCSFTASSFAELGVCPELLASCESLNWRVPTPIQQKVLAVTLTSPASNKVAAAAPQGDSVRSSGGSSTSSLALRRDIIGLAETGSGKTGAFAIPILQQLLDAPQRLFALILAPTRELCLQISQCFSALGECISLEVATILGGMDFVAQALALAKRPHVIVASPGRLVDHLENTKGFNLSTIQFLVLDEADRLLSLDFDAAIDKILEVLPRKRTTYLFSATMTSKVSKLQRASLRKPCRVEVNGRYDTVQGLQQFYILVPLKLKFTYLCGLAQHFQKYKIMLFTNTCVMAKRLAMFLRHLSFNSVCLYGKMTQPQRIGALNQFKAGLKTLLVATEVGSRGLDIPDVEVVMNFDVPASSKDYIHRVGRTARAGRTGSAITFVTQYDVEAFQKIEQALAKKLAEFTRVEEEKIMSYHSKCLEALRTADAEVKENDEEFRLQRQKKSRKPIKGSYLRGNMSKKSRAGSG